MHAFLKLSGLDAGSVLEARPAREVTRPSQAEAEMAVRTLIRWAGDNPDREGLIDTPARVCRAYLQWFAGYDEDPVEFLGRTFEEAAGYDEMVVLRNIRFVSHCEHHMAPIHGRAHIGYLPRDRVVGISKVARVVAAFCKRLQIQERMTAEIANSLEAGLQPHGVAVVLEGPMDVWPAEASTNVTQPWSQAACSVCFASSRRSAMSSCRPSGSASFQSAGTFSPEVHPIAEPSKPGRPMQVKNPIQIRDLDALHDADLVRMAVQRDERAFRIIMQRHNRRLYRCARSIVRDDSEAEDIVQEAYVNAFGNLSSFRGDSSLATWLTRITVNEALTRVRRRRPTVELAALDAVARDRAEVIPFPLKAMNTDPERTAAQREIRHLIERAIDDLPEAFRSVFVMREIEGMGVEETANLLGLRQATVKTRLHRARRLLRKALDAQLATTLTEAFPFDGMRCVRTTDAILRRLGLSAGPGA